jgi:hypothetical protein
MVCISEMNPPQRHDERRDLKPVLIASPCAHRASERPQNGVSVQILDKIPDGQNASGKAPSCTLLGKSPSFDHASFWRQMQQKNGWPI